MQSVSNHKKCFELPFQYRDFINFHIVLNYTIDQVTNAAIAAHGNFIA